MGGEHPERLELAERILSLPFKRSAQREVPHFELAEVQAVLNAIDRSTQGGRRDFVLLTLMFNTVARVSEIVALRATDLRLTPPPRVRIYGKGSKPRVCPVWPETARLLSEHLEEHQITPHQPAIVFRNHWRTPLTRFGVRVILRKYVQQAARTLPVLMQKRLHPHSLRQATAIHLLRAGVDLSTIAHWLGHASLNTTNNTSPLTWKPNEKY